MSLIHGAKICLPLLFDDEIIEMLYQFLLFVAQNTRH